MVANNSSYLVYNFLNNMAQYSKGKQIDLFKTSVPMFVYKNSPVYMIRHCKRIWNEMENGIYDYFDVAILYLYRKLFDMKTNASDIDKTKIEVALSVFTPQQLKKDKAILLATSKKSNIEHISTFFEINEDGDNIIHLMIKQHLISPMIFIQYCNKYLTNDLENIKLLNDDLKKFLVTIKVLKTTLMKGVTNG